MHERRAACMGAIVIYYSPKRNSSAIEQEARIATWERIHVRLMQISKILCQVDHNWISLLHVHTHVHTERKISQELIYTDSMYVYERRSTVCAWKEREREGERGVVHTIWNSNTHIHGAGEQISYTARTKKKFFFGWKAGVWWSVVVRWLQWSEHYAR